MTMQVVRGRTKARRARSFHHFHQKKIVIMILQTTQQLRACSSRSITARVSSESGPSCRYTSATELSSSGFFTGTLAGTMVIHMTVSDANMKCQQEVQA